MRSLSGEASIGMPDGAGRRPVSEITGKLAVMACAGIRNDGIRRLKVAVL